MHTDSGVPIPHGIQKGRPAKYPWRTMQVGESFLAPHIPLRSMRGMAHRSQLTTGYKYECRAEETGTRVWRMA